MRSKRLVLALTMGLAIIIALGLSSASLAADTWQVRTITTPVQGRTPSFLSADGNLIAWTGASPTDSRTYLYNLATGKNVEISKSLVGSYYNPSIDGQSVVFQGGRPGAYDDIFLYEANNGLLTQITYNTAVGDANDWNPRIQNGRVVWQKTGANPGIYLYEVGIGHSTMILSGSDYHDADIYGDYVVCIKGVVEEGTVSSQLILHSLATNETVAITDASKDNQDPRIDGNKIVWSQGDAWSQNSPKPGKTYQIAVYDIDAQTTTVLTNSIAGNVLPDIEGDLVAWQTTLTPTILVRDLSADSNILMPPKGDTVGGASVDGTMVAWFGSKGLYTAVSPDEATTFPDVPETHPNYAAIEGMAAQGIIDGYTTGYFGPNDLVIRQQFAKMIVLTMGYTATLTDEFPFTDAASITRVDNELYAYHYVAKAALTGLTIGYPDGSFRPFNNITRQQIITMVVRAGSQVLEPAPAGWKGQLSYNDPTHGENIRLAEYNGLLNGIVGPSGGLQGWNPAGTATRAECAQFLWNLYNLLNPGS